MNNAIVFETNTYKINLLVDYINEVFEDNNNVVILFEDLKIIFIKPSHKDAVECVNHIQELLEKADYSEIARTICELQEENS